MEFLNLQIEERTKIFINNALLTNRGFNYYVDWTNVNGYNEFMVEIHAMDILIGCKDDNDFKDKFITLISKLPHVVLLFPFLFGLAKDEREKLYRNKTQLTIIQDELNCADHLIYSFSKNTKYLDDNEIEIFYNFFVRMGLKNLYQNFIEKSTLDYIIGVLVGYGVFKIFRNVFQWGYKKLETNSNAFLSYIKCVCDDNSDALLK